VLGLADGHCYHHQALNKRAPNIYLKTLVLAACAGTVTLCAKTSAFAQDAAAARRAAIDARLKAIRPSQKKLSIAPGDTAFLEATVAVAAQRLRGDSSAYEGLVQGIVAPKGVVVHRRVHEFEFLPDGNRVQVRLVYAIHVEPGTVAAGKVRLTLALVERRGLANTVAKKAIQHTVRIATDRPSPREVAADFYGYRYYRRRAQRRRKALQRFGLRLSLKDQDRLPPLDRAPDKVATQALQYDRERRLFWVA